MLIYSRDELGQLVDPKLAVATVIADLHGRLKVAEATLTAAQAENTRLVEENRKLKEDNWRI